jgi:hypothetical protein
LKQVIYFANDSFDDLSEVQKKHLMQSLNCEIFPVELSALVMDRSKKVCENCGGDGSLI